MTWQDKRTSADKFLEFLGEDLPQAPLPKPCTGPETCELCKTNSHCNLFPECSPDCTENHKLAGEPVNYYHPVDYNPTTTTCEITYSPGHVVNFDIENLKWTQSLEPSAGWEAHLCARGGEVLVITDEKAPWYARVFARLLGLEWKWVEVQTTDVVWNGYGKIVHTPCFAGEDLPLGSVVANNDGTATAAK